MFRKLFLLLTTMLFLLSSVTSSLAETTPAKNLTLNEAVELALQNNIDFIKAGLDYEQAVMDMEQAQKNAKNIDDKKVDNLQTAQSKYVSSKQKELAETVAKQAYEIAKEQTKNLVEKNYYDVLKAEKLLKIKESSVYRAQEQLKLVQKKYKAGTAVKTEVTRAEISLASSRSEMINVQRDLKNTQVTFNKILGLEVNEDVKLANVLKYEQVTLPDKEELITQALKTRLEIQKARNTQAIAKLNYSLAVSYESEITYTARRYKIELKKAELEVLQQEQNIKADIISTLFQVQKGNESVQLLTKSLEQAKENQSLAKRRYEIGVGTLIDVLTASLDLADSEAKYTEAVYNYTLSKNQLKTVTLVSK